MPTAPAYRSSGTPTGPDGSVAISPPMPAGWQENDILVILVERGGSGSLSTPAGWTALFNSGTSGSVFWKRATAGETPPIISGTNLLGQMHAFSGCTTTETPIDAATPVQNQGSGSTFSTGTLPGSTSRKNTLVVIGAFWANNRNSVSQASGWTNANLTGLTERYDFSVGSEYSTRGGFALATGVKETLSGIGATTGSFASSNTWSAFQFALLPLAPTEVDAALPAMTLSPPEATVRGDGVAEGALPAVALSSPEGVATVSITATGALPGLSLTPPEGGATGSADVSASLPGMVVSPPEGHAAEVLRVEVSLPEMTLSPPEAVVTGSALVLGALPGLIVSPPVATVATGAGVTGALPAMLLTPPEGDGREVWLAQGALPSITLTPPQAIAGQRAITPVGRRAIVPSSRAAARRASIPTSRLSGRRAHIEE